MARYDYKVIPAPRRGTKAPDAKTPDERFARSVETALNDLAAAGWEFVRTETLNCDERQGLTGTRTEMRTLLVFRRQSGHGAGVPDEDHAPAPRRADPPADLPPPDLDDDVPREPPTSSGSRSVGRPPRLGPARRD